MEYQDFLAAFKNSTEVPSVDEAFYYAFCKPKPKSFDLTSAEGRQAFKNEMESR